MNNEMLLKLVEIYKKVSLANQAVNEALHTEDSVLSYLEEDLQSLVLDLIGIPANTFNDETREGFCRDYFYDIFVEGFDKPEDYIKAIQDEYQSGLEQAEVK